MPRAAGIVLAGGRSSRMGTAKAALEWHGSTLLRRVAGLVARAVDGPVVVVRAPEQELPELPADVAIVQDAREGRGPLQGLAAGLLAVRTHADVAFVASTDVPLLHPLLVTRVVAGLPDDADLAVPYLDGFPQPLAAAYRTEVLETVERLIAVDRLRVTLLLEECRVRRLDPQDLLADASLAALDPALDSLRNVNDPAAYAAARARPAPQVTVQGRGPVAAATLGEAASRAGLTLHEHAAVVLNGSPIAPDPEVPLVAGDTVVFDA